MESCSASDIFVAGVVVAASHEDGGHPVSILYDSQRAPNAIFLFDAVHHEVTKVLCNGDIPPPTVGCAMCVVGDKCYLVGGRQTTTSMKARMHLLFHVLDLASFCWRDESGNSGSALPIFRPQHRSHHVAVPFQKRYILVHGGCPEYLDEYTADDAPAGNDARASDRFGTADDHALPPCIHSAGAMRAAAVGGFFDVFLYDTVFQGWSRFCPGFPACLSHSATVFYDNFLVLFGGLILRLDRGVDQAPAETEIAAHLYLLDMRNSKWSLTSNDETPQATTTPSQRSSGPRSWPLPRMGARVAAMDAWLLLCGGKHIDGLGRVTSLFDLWAWSVASGEWLRLECCVTDWQGAVPVLFVDRQMSADGGAVSSNPAVMSLVFSCDLRQVFRLPSTAIENAFRKQEAQLAAPATTRTVGRASSTASNHTSSTLSVPLVPVFEWGHKPENPEETRHEATTNAIGGALFSARGWQKDAAIVAFQSWEPLPYPSNVLAEAKEAIANEGDRAKANVVVEEEEKRIRSPDDNGIRIVADAPFVHSSGFRATPSPRSHSERRSRSELAPYLPLTSAPSLASPSPRRSVSSAVLDLLTDVEAGEVADAVDDQWLQLLPSFRSGSSSSRAASSVPRSRGIVE